MSTTLAVWLVIFFVAGAANLPFLTTRLLGVIPLKTPKTLGLRLLELLVLYVLAGGFGILLEQRLGQIASQTWEFYAITAALFLTFSFPGFVYRYLLKRSD